METKGPVPFKKRKGEPHVKHIKPAMGFTKEADEEEKQGSDVADKKKKKSAAEILYPSHGPRR